MSYTSTRTSAGSVRSSTVSAGLADDERSNTASTGTRTTCTSYGTSRSSAYNADRSHTSYGTNSSFTSQSSGASIDMPPVPHPSPASSVSGGQPAITPTATMILAPAPTLATTSPAPAPVAPTSQDGDTFERVTTSQDDVGSIHTIPEIAADRPFNIAQAIKKYPKCIDFLAEQLTTPHDETCASFTDLTMAMVTQRAIETADMISNMEARIMAELKETARQNDLERIETQLEGIDAKLNNKFDSVETQLAETNRLLRQFLAGQADQK